MKEQFKFSDLLLRKRIGLGETNIPHGFSLRALMIDVLDKLNLINDTGATCFKKWFTHFYSAVDKPNTCLRLWVSVSTFFKLYENLIPAFRLLSLSIAQRCQKIAHPDDHIADNPNCYILIRNSYAIEQKTIGQFYRFNNPLHFFKETLFRKLNKIVHQFGNHFFIPVANCFNKVIKNHAEFLSKIVGHESRVICLKNSFVRKISTFHKVFKQWKSYEDFEHFENIPVLGIFSAREGFFCDNLTHGAVVPCSNRRNNSVFEAVKKTVRKPEGSLVLEGTVKHPDYPSSSTTAEIISTNAPIGTQSVTQSLASCLLFCANISTEIDDFDRFIGDLPKITSARLLAQSGRCRVCRGKMHTCTAFHSESFDSLIPARILYWQRLKSLFSRLDISLGDKTKRPVFTIPLREFYTTLKTAFSAYSLNLLSLGWIRYETAIFA